MWVFFLFWFWWVFTACGVFWDHMMMLMLLLKKKRKVFYIGKKKSCFFLLLCVALLLVGFLFLEISTLGVISFCGLVFVDFFVMHPICFFLFYSNCYSLLLLFFLFLVNYFLVWWQYSSKVMGSWVYTLFPGVGWEKS